MNKEQSGELFDKLFNTLKITPPTAKELKGVLSFIDKSKEFKVSFEDFIVAIKQALNAMLLSAGRPPPPPKEESKTDGRKGTEGSPGKPADPKAAAPTGKGKVEASPPKNVPTPQPPAPSPPAKKGRV